MDSYEATRVVFSRIQSFDPENASKITDLLLIQDHGEKEMIRLAFGPESLVHSVILKSRKDLGLSSNTPSTHSITLSRQNSSNSSASSRLLNGVSLPSPLSIPNPSSSASSWAGACNFSEYHQNPKDLSSPNSCPNHYNLRTSNGINNLGIGLSSSSTMNSSAPFYGSTEREPNLIDEFQLQDQLSFLNDGPKFPDFYYPQQDLALSPNESGLLTPTVAAAPGDGEAQSMTSCRFLHGGLSDSDGAAIGSPSKLEMMEQCRELLRSKSAQQQSKSPYFSVQDMRTKISSRSEKMER